MFFYFWYKKKHELIKTLLSDCYGDINEITFEIKKSMENILIIFKKKFKGCKMEKK